MTIEEFNEIEWRANMKAEYLKTEHDVISVDFLEKEIFIDNGEEQYWISYKNITIIEY